MKRYRIPEKGNAEDIHFEGVQNGDYTLCGLTLAADRDIQTGEAKEVSQRVSCPHCIAIVKACKAIHHASYETTVQQATRNFHK